MADLFSAHTTETDWEWSDQRRTICKTPKGGAWAGVGTFIVGMMIRGLFGDPNWLIASLVAGLVAVIVALGAPKVETAFIWLRRHKIRLDELTASPAPVPTPSPTVSPVVAAPAERPKADVTLECDRTGVARLRIRNAGAGATFAVTLQLHGLTAGAVEHRQVFARWELGEGAHQRLSRGETRVIWLGTVTQIAPSVRAWVVHRAAGEDISRAETSGTGKRGSCPRRTLTWA